MNQTEGNPFEIKDCAMLVIATGKSARNLRELRDNLFNISSGSIYYHFWGHLLQPKFEEPEYNNDFAAWVRHSLHDPILAERLSVINPIEFLDIENLRARLIELIEERLEESELILWAMADQQFYFLQSKTVVFYTRKIINRPEEWIDIISQLSVGSIFYHFIDARRRNPERIDDLRNWLLRLGEERCAPLIAELNAIDPYFSSLTELRSRLSFVFSRCLEGK